MLLFTYKKRIKPIRNSAGAMMLSIKPIHFISVRMSSLIIARPELKNTIKVLK